MPAYRYTTKAGYVKLKCEHPLASPEGVVFEHRAVAYDNQGTKPLACHWCAQSLTWADAVVDHLNERKADNHPTNLVVSCNDCNRARGAMVPFIRRLTSEGLQTLVRVLTEVNGQIAKARLTA